MGLTKSEKYFAVIGTIVSVITIVIVVVYFIKKDNNSGSDDDDKSDKNIKTATDLKTEEKKADDKKTNDPPKPQPPKESYCTTYSGADYPGNDILNVPIGSANECAKSCFSNADCDYAVYNNSKCYLKKTLPTQDRYIRYKIKNTDGTFRFVDSKTKNTDIPYYDIETVDNLVGSADNAQFEAPCKEKCTNNDKCKFYVASRDLKKCWLKGAGASPTATTIFLAKNNVFDVNDINCKAA